MRILRLITIFLITYVLTASNAHAGKIAIVIDDIGNQASDKKLLTLNQALTFAILPHTPYSTAFSKQATEQKRDVIIHLPMQANKGNQYLGPGALTMDMTKQQFQQTLIAAIEDVPYAVGINNHMGSLLTRLDQPMQWTMELLRQHNMFFLDSKTTVLSKVEPIADQYGVNALHRNIFLDHVRKPEVMAFQFQRLINIAREYGSAIAIGHPYPETYQLLQQNLPLLASMGVELVPLSKLLPSNISILDNLATRDGEEIKHKAKSKIAVDFIKPTADKVAESAL